MSSENANGLRTVLRGYDPVEVERRFTDMTATTDSARQHAAALAREVDRLRGALDAANAANAAASSTTSPADGERGGRTDPGRRPS